MENEMKEFKDYAKNCTSAMKALNATDPENLLFKGCDKLAELLDEKHNTDKFTKAWVKMA